MSALQELRSYLVNYQLQHPVDGLEVLPVHEIRSRGDRFDAKGVLYAQGETFGGIIRNGAVVGSVTGATSPHTNIELPSIAIRDYLSEHKLDGSGCPVIFPQEYQFGKVVPEMVGVESTVPAHTLSLMWKEGAMENSRL